MVGIDLHIHTDASPDGDVPCEGIFKIAKGKGISCLAITDHNDTSSLSEAHRLSLTYGIELIPGIEFNTNFNGRDVHILGYFVDYSGREFRRIIQEITERKEEQAKARVEKLKTLGFKINYHDAVEAARGKIPNGSVFLDALLMHPENRRNSVLRRYIDGDRSDSPHFNFYRDFFRYGKPAYVPLLHIETGRIIELLHSSGALAIIAHPYDIPDPEIMKIIDLGVDGLEAYSSYHTEEHITHFRELAKKNKILITAGSDFHGSHKPKIEPGIFIPEGGEIVERLKERVREKWVQI